MIRRSTLRLVMALVVITPFLVGCPGEDAVIGGVADGVTDGLAAAIEAFITGILGL